MEEKIQELFKAVNQQNQEQIAKTIEEFDVSIYPMQQMSMFISIVMMEYKRVDPEKLPYVLEALYKSNNKLKFYLFCILLKDSYERIPFLTNLENIFISKEKFEILLPFLTEIVNNSYNGIANCMYLILLKAIENEEFFDKEIKEQLIEGINKKLEIILDGAKDKQKLEESVAMDLEIIVDVTRYLYNEKTNNLVDKCWKFDNENVLLFLIIKNLDDNKPVDQKCIEKVSGNILYAEKLYAHLEKKQKQNLFPEKYNNQEYIAKSNMVNWLLYPTELGKIPNYIESVGTFEEGDEVFYIFQFTSSLEAYKRNDKMIGVSGGYRKQEIPTAQNSGYTFSTFATITEDFKKQAQEIVNMIRDYWQNRN